MSVVRHLMRRHETLRARSVIRAGVSWGRGLGEWRQRGVGDMRLPIRTRHQGGLGVTRLMGMEWRPRVAREPIRSEVRRHPRVWRHPRIHPNPLHHGLAGLAKLGGSEAVRASIGHHVAVILLTWVTRMRPASLLKVFVTQRRYPTSGHKLRPVGAGSDPHVVGGEGEAGRQRGFGEPLHDPVG